MAITTWRKELTEAFKENGDSWDDVEKITMGDQILPHREYADKKEYIGEQLLDHNFDDQIPYHEGTPFWLWTSRHVYFAVLHDGDEWVACVPRHPCEGKPVPIGEY